MGVEYSCDEDYSTPMGVEYSRFLFLKDPPYDISPSTDDISGSTYKILGFNL